MISNKYLYGLIDLSYVLSKNIWVISRDKKINEFSPGDVIRMTIQGFNKFARDFGITCDKYVAIYDRWDSSVGGYFGGSLIKPYVQYKGTRRYMNEQLLEEIRSNPESTQEEIEKAELELYTNQVKTKAKYAMIDDLKNIGVPCIGVPGWEYDNLVYLFAGLMFGRTAGKKSVIITKDSDLMYSTTPELDFFKVSTGGSEPKIITYDEMYYTIPEPIRNQGISLYQYRAYTDALGEGHNDMLKTKRPHADVTQTILQILKGDYMGIEVDKIDAFKAQLMSFDISQYPRFSEASDMILNYLPGAGHYGSIDDFHKFCVKHGVSGISDKYYTDFISRFDQKMFSE